MVSVSQSAQNYFLNLLKKQKYGTNIRVYVKYPGTPVAKCGVSYCYKDDVTRLDVAFTMNKFIVYVYKPHIPYLRESKIDINVEECNSQLTLIAPYANKCYFIKNNDLKRRVENFLNLNINPQLSAHGGKVDLMNITESGYLSLKFSGGCNGCSMVQKTLKEGIEKQILAKFSEFKGVYDITQHNRGNHSYY
ncbi:YhgI [Buchnera aphidicola str. Bp (Baizongia pistaciae)]|uniref:Fe/S biogenesis protein NfuA n=1 Tax=Buchnera aphidicola subsp. Baizongia pistaciae (strain Bp) TaxID=224915 RepID=NFUA_BUCBP|nr:NfuA family Fe-S biogenesis protein [Buchnera aphidicola]Q89A55.1 RecName: Full=Fe/S biogenesis protein NfuA [Buchnera aphidicola str. Bp (Baizongia pistaciae)]AAO27191.1 YhgI [Buchnera aphidicola str. Bp (Baizongia pistaciae)]